MTTATIKKHHKAKERAQFIVKELLNDQVVELTHDAHSIQKMVSTVELVKQELEDQGKTYYQYNKVSQDKSIKRTRDDQIGSSKVPRTSSASSVADSIQRQGDSLDLGASTSTNIANSQADSGLTEDQSSNFSEKSSFQVNFSISLSLYPQSKYSDWTLQTNKGTKHGRQSEPKANKANAQT
uniref:ARAD1A17644p n=1 Tax=Blastobotrys adeninivorans TaxID=409370 RepID=A0A060T4H9_BLAAD